MPWFKPRGYRHFDDPVTPEWANEFVTDPEKVAKHRFLPFIGYMKSAPRYNRLARSTEIKERPIAYSSHRDSHVFSFYAQELGRRYETFIATNGLSENVIGYRALGKSNIHLAAEVFDQIERRGECAAVGLDISGFFDHIRHDVLKRSWAALLDSTSLPNDHYAVYWAITKFAIVDRAKVLKALAMTISEFGSGRMRLCASQEFRQKIIPLISRNANSYGIPQGSPISALASNVAMMEFDVYVARLLHEVGGIYRRYSDDVFFLADENSAPLIESLIEAKLGELGLNIKHSKTVRSRFSMIGNRVHLAHGSPFPYLGFTFDGQRRLVRSSSISRYTRKVKSKIAAAKRNAKKAAGPGRKIFRKSIHERFTHLGTRPNFINYGYRAAEIMQSRAIRRQFRRHTAFISRSVEEAEES